MTTYPSPTRSTRSVRRRRPLRHGFRRGRITAQFSPTMPPLEIRLGDTRLLPARRAIIANVSRRRGHGFRWENDALPGDASSRRRGSCSPGDASRAATPPRTPARFYSWTTLLVAALAVIIALIVDNTRQVKIRWVFGSSYASLVWIILVVAIVVGLPAWPLASSPPAGSAGPSQPRRRLAGAQVLLFGLAADKAHVPVRIRSAAANRGQRHPYRARGTSSVAICGNCDSVCTGSCRSSAKRSRAYAPCSPSCSGHPSRTFVAIGIAEAEAASPGRLLKLLVQLVDVVEPTHRLVRTPDGVHVLSAGVV